MSSDQLKSTWVQDILGDILNVSMSRESHGDIQFFMNDLK
ncbi:MAG: hypothetical protein RI913_775, partial [Pseudomonadota bacterium]